MTGGRLDAAGGQPVGGPVERRTECPGLAGVAEPSRAAVRRDVSDRLRRAAGVPERGGDRPAERAPLRIRSDQLECIVPIAVAGDLSIDPGTPAPGGLQLL